MDISVGCGQITWPRGTSPDAILADIAEAGYDGAPLAGGRSAAEVCELFDRYGLRPAPGYFGGDFWVAERRKEYVDAAARYAAVSRALGVTELYVSAGGFQDIAPSGRTRRAAAAHATPEDALPPREFARLAHCVEAIAKATLAEGVRSCYHSHVGTYVETEDEIERLLAMVDPDVLFLGPDTGHLAWAGIDVVDFVRRHATRIRTMHLKDMDAAVREAGVAAEWDYGTFEEHGLWTELGEGSVDFPAVLDVLHRNAFSGWLIVETDVTQRETPLESASISRRYLRTLGL